MNYLAPISTYLIDLPDFNQEDKAKAFLDLKNRQSAIEGILFDDSTEILDLIEESINIDDYIETTVANVNFVINHQFYIEGWT